MKSKLLKFRIGQIVETTDEYAELIEEANVERKAIGYEQLPEYLCGRIVGFEDHNDWLNSTVYLIDIRNGLSKKVDEQFLRPAKRNGDVLTSANIYDFIHKREEK